MFAPFRQVKILPVLIVVLALAFGVRLNAFMTGTHTTEGLAFAEQVSEITPQAGDEAAAEPPEANPEAQAEPDQIKEEGKEEPAKQAEGNLGEPPPAAKEGAWRDSMDEQLEYSEVRMELFEDLSNRRAALEKKEKELKMREALLKAAEQELDQKYKELTSLREEIQALLKTQSEEENARIASLVKIYEGMKAKDAARIFNTLDTDVLLDVMGKMSERKSAPILAAMNADRARSITILLAEQKALPDMEKRLGQ